MQQLLPRKMDRRDSDARQSLRIYEVENGTVPRFVPPSKSSDGGQLTPIFFIPSRRRIWTTHSLTIKTFRAIRAAWTILLGLSRTRRSLSLHSGIDMPHPSQVGSALGVVLHSFVSAGMMRVVRAEWGDVVHAAAAGSQFERECVNSIDHGRADPTRHSAHFSAVLARF